MPRSICGRRKRRPPLPEPLPARPVRTPGPVKKEAGACLIKFGFGPGLKGDGGFPVSLRGPFGAGARFTLFATPERAATPPRTGPIERANPFRKAVNLEAHRASG